MDYMDPNVCCPQKAIKFTHGYFAGTVVTMQSWQSFKATLKK